MPPTDTRIASIRTAQRPGPDRPTEDRIFTATDAVVVLDGASQPDANEYDGGWLADVLGRQLVERLSTHGGDLATVLGAAIASVADRYGLTPGTAPSTTVSIVRWTASAVEALVLGDSPVIVLARNGEIDQLRDDRLRRVAGQQRASHHHADTGQDRSERWRHLVDAERARRNRPGGYWIAEATPEAAAHAYRRSWHRADLAAVLVMSDGVSAGVDRYSRPSTWATAVDVARGNPEELIRLVHETEADDPDCTRWPRGKRHDDKALAVIEFDPA